MHTHTHTPRVSLPSLSPTNHSEPSGPLREVAPSPLAALLPLTLSLSSPSAISSRLSFPFFFLLLHLLLLLLFLLPHPPLKQPAG